MYVYSVPTWAQYDLGRTIRNLSNASVGTVWREGKQLRNRRDELARRSASDVSRGGALFAYHSGTPTSLTML